jgi:hypothetical protein
MVLGWKGAEGTLAGVRTQALKLFIRGVDFFIILN